MNQGMNLVSPNRAINVVTVNEKLLTLIDCLNECLVNTTVIHCKITGYTPEPVDTGQKQVNPVEEPIRSKIVILEEKLIGLLTGLKEINEQL